MRYGVQGIPTMLIVKTGKIKVAQKFWDGSESGLHF